MSHSSRNVDALLEGFTAAGGWINKEVFTLRMIESMGFGAVAVTEVQVSRRPGIDSLNRSPIRRCFTFRII